MIEIQSGLRTRANAERFGHPSGQLTCTGNKVGVEVGIERICQSEADPFGDLQVPFDVTLRVDDGGLSCFSGSDQIGCVAKPLVDELLVQQIGPLHCLFLFLSVPRFPGKSDELEVPCIFKWDSAGRRRGSCWEESRPPRLPNLSPSSAGGKLQKPNSIELGGIVRFVAGHPSDEQQEGNVTVSYTHLTLPT